MTHGKLAALFNCIGHAPEVAVPTPCKGSWTSLRFQETIIKVSGKTRDKRKQLRALENDGNVDRKED